MIANKIAAEDFSADVGARETDIRGANALLLVTAVQAVSEAVARSLRRVAVSVAREASNVARQVFR